MAGIRFIIVVLYFLGSYLLFKLTEIKVLPESCSNLHNLEVMHLSLCDRPKDVLNNFTKLKQFIYYSQRKPMILEGVGKLVFLRSLVYEVREKPINEAECSVCIEELGNLNFLEELAIVNLENVKDPIDAERVNLKGKQNLRQLYLSWDWGEREEELCAMGRDQKACNDVQVLQALQPPPGLITLIIGNLMGSDFPTWMCPSSLPELADLGIVNCSGIKQLPACIRKLPRLKSLNLIRMSLKSLDIGGFPFLTSLDLTDMFLLEELCYSYPYLQNLSIINCKSLQVIPSFPSLRKLILEKVDHKLIFSVGRSQASFTELSLENIEELTYFPMNVLQNNCNLRLLQIKSCYQFEGFGVNDDEFDNDSRKFHSGSLHTLEFIDCPVLEFLPDLRGWTSLQKLTIFNCPQVKESMPYDPKSLSFLSYLYVDFLQREEQRGDPSSAKDLINLMNK